MDSMEREVWKVVWKEVWKEVWKVEVGSDVMLRSGPCRRGCSEGVSLKESLLYGDDERKRKRGGKRGRAIGKGGEEASAREGKSPCRLQIDGSLVNADKGDALEGG